jgi:lysozyme
MKIKLTLSPSGLALIKKFEGLRLSAYRCIAGIWTIGYGSTYYRNGTSVKKGDKLADIHQADELFKYTLQHFEQAVNQLVQVPLTQNQFNALVSFAYNAGTNALGKSTLLKLLNQGNYEAAAKQFLIWNKITDPATGKKIVAPDLTRRRIVESELFLKP